MGWRRPWLFDLVPCTVYLIYLILLERREESEGVVLDIRWSTVPIPRQNRSIRPQYKAAYLLPFRIVRSRSRLSVSLDRTFLLLLFLFTFIVIVQSWVFNMIIFAIVPEEKQALNLCLRQKQANSSPSPSLPQRKSQFSSQTPAPRQCHYRFATPIVSTSVSTSATSPYLVPAEVQVQVQVPPGSRGCGGGANFEPRMALHT